MFMNVRSRFPKRVRTEAAGHETGLRHRKRRPSGRGTDADAGEYGLRDMGARYGGLALHHRGGIDYRSRPRKKMHEGRTRRDPYRDIAQASHHHALSAG